MRLSREGLRPRFPREIYVDSGSEAGDEFFIFHMKYARLFAALFGPEKFRPSFPSNPYRIFGFDTERLFHEEVPKNHYP